MKRIVICCDGTWGTPESPFPTNISRMARAVLPLAGGTDQVVFYDWGLGTETGQRLRGGGIGVGIDKNICDAYRFLCHNYIPGDEIYLFGFSRGAYTVRSLIGMLRACGLTPKHLEHRIPRIYQQYREGDSADSQRARMFRMDNWTVTIKFLGVWDTVGALGIPLRLTQFLFGRKKYGFHDTRLSGIVEHAYHALALDEQRRVFSPSLWVTDPNRKNTEQHWFRGEHSDIGGGSENIELSNTTFLWMAKKCTQVGLGLDDLYLSQLKAGGEMRKKSFSLLRIFGRQRRLPLKTNHDETLH